MKIKYLAVVVLVAAFAAVLLVGPAFHAKADAPTDASTGYNCWSQGGGRTDPTTGAPDIKDHLFSTSRPFAVGTTPENYNPYFLGISQVTGFADCTYRNSIPNLLSSEDIIQNPPFGVLWKSPTVTGFYNWFDKPTGVFDYVGDKSNASTTEYPESANLAGGQEAFRIARVLDPAYNTQPEMDYYVGENKSNPTVAFLVAPYTGERLNVAGLLNQYYTEGAGVAGESDDYFAKVFLHMSIPTNKTYQVYDFSNFPVFDQSYWAATAPVVSSGALGSTDRHLFINPSGSQPSDGNGIVLPDESTYTGPPSCQQIWNALPAAVQHLPADGAADNVAIAGDGYDYEYYANSAADFCSLPGANNARYQAWTKAVYAQGCAAGGNIDAKSCGLHGYTVVSTSTIASAAACVGVTVVPTGNQTCYTQACQTTQIAKLTAALGSAVTSNLVSNLGAQQVATDADGIIAGEAMLANYHLTPTDYIAPGDSISNYPAGTTAAQIAKQYFLSLPNAGVPEAGEYVRSGGKLITIIRPDGTDFTLPAFAQQTDPWGVLPNAADTSRAGQAYLTVYNQALAMQKGGCWPPATVATTTQPLAITPPATCNTLWWHDSTDTSCSSQKQFCGAYMYQGLETFSSQNACQADVSSGSSTYNSTTATALLNALEQLLALLEALVTQPQGAVTSTPALTPVQQFLSEFATIFHNIVSSTPPTAVTPPVVACYTFTTNLSLGTTGPGVTALQTDLEKDGETVTVNGTFDDQTASAVSAFQEKYAKDILTPNGLNAGTGYVGPSTIAKLNALYGCNGGGSVVCAQDTQKCSDGSYVSRVAPSCQFATCPVITNGTSSPGSGTLFNFTSTYANDHAPSRGTIVNLGPGWYWDNEHSACFQETAVTQYPYVTNLHGPYSQAACQSAFAGNCSSVAQYAPGSTADLSCPPSDRGCGQGYADGGFFMSGDSTNVLDGNQDWFSSIRVQSGYIWSGPYTANETAGNVALNLAHKYDSGAKLVMVYLDGEFAGQPKVALIERTDGTYVVPGEFLKAYYTATNQNQGFVTQDVVLAATFGSVKDFLSIPIIAANFTSIGPCPIDPVRYATAIYNAYHYDFDINGEWATFGNNVSVPFLLDPTKAKPVAVTEAATNANGFAADVLPDGLNTFNDTGGLINVPDPKYPLTTNTIVVDPAKGDSMYYKWGSMFSSSSSFTMVGILKLNNNRTSYVPVTQDACGNTVKYGPYGTMDPSQINPFNWNLGTAQSLSANANNWSPLDLKTSGSDPLNGMSGPYKIQACQAGYQYVMYYTVSNSNGTINSPWTISVVGVPSN